MHNDRKHRNAYDRLIWLFIGLIIVTIGVSTLLGIDIWNYLWPMIIILVGILIIVGALLGRDGDNDGRFK
jgi:hypothetical protein